MLIYSHRANINGPDSMNLAVCVEKGWGVELDLRRSQGGGWYFDHVPRGYSRITDARHILNVTRDVPKAINIKEVGFEEEAVVLLKPFGNLFVFDMELLGPYVILDYRELARAGRVSDRRGEDWSKHIGDCVWLDEFDPWVTKRDLEGHNTAIYWVSPELHRPLTAPHHFKRLEDRWQEMTEWGVTGICTDYPATLEARLTEWKVAA